MKNVISFVFLLINCIAHSQEYEVTGKIINSKTQEKIEFVNIGISNKGVGTVSNENGLFNLKLNELVNTSDSIIFHILDTKLKLLKLLNFQLKRLLFY